MRRLDFWIQNWLKIKPRCRTILVRQDDCAFWNLSLAGNAIAEWDSTFFQTLADAGHQCLILNQLQAEQIRYDFARDIIRSRPEAAGNEKNIVSWKHFVERVSNSRTIRDCTLFVN